MILPALATLCVVIVIFVVIAKRYGDLTPADANWPEWTR